MKLLMLLLLKKVLDTYFIFNEKRIAKVINLFAKLRLLKNRQENDI